MVNLKSMITVGRHRYMVIGEAEKYIASIMNILQFFLFNNLEYIWWPNNINKQTFVRNCMWINSSPEICVPHCKGKTNSSLNNVGLLAQKSMSESGWYKLLDSWKPFLTLSDISPQITMYFSIYYKMQVFPKIFCVRSRILRVPVSQIPYKYPTLVWIFITNWNIPFTVVNYLILRCSIC